MKRLALLSVVLPGAALAHGGHAPVPETVHGLVHTAPLALVGVAAVLAVGFYSLWRNRQ